MKKLFAATTFLALAGSAAADGTIIEQVFDGTNGLASERNTAVTLATTADDFVITDKNTITAIQATFLAYNNFPLVDWELVVYAHDEINDQPDEDDILHFVNGGVATYDGYDDIVHGLGVYTVSFDSLNLPLDAGLYWLGIRGVGTGNSPGSQRAFWGTANYGAPNGNRFHDSRRSRTRRSRAARSRRSGRPSASSSPVITLPHCASGPRPVFARSSWISTFSCQILGIPAQAGGTHGISACGHRVSNARTRAEEPIMPICNRSLETVIECLSGISWGPEFPVTFARTDPVEVGSSPDVFRSCQVRVRGAK